MEALIDYIVSHTVRGECQCGKCADKQPDRDAPVHSADAIFFWVSAVNDPTKRELDALLRAEYPNVERLREGPSYIEIGGVLGSQELAIRLIGLGGILGLWHIASGKDFRFPPKEVLRLAEGGFLMPAGYQPMEAC